MLAQLEHGGNMTDVIAALGTLANLDLPERETTLAAFYARWNGFRPARILPRISPKWSAMP